jgi:hypothetical protein
MRIKTHSKHSTNTLPSSFAKRKITRKPSNDARVKLIYVPISIKWRVWTNFIMVRLHCVILGRALSCLLMRMMLDRCRKGGKCCQWAARTFDEVLLSKLGQPATCSSWEYSVSICYYVSNWLLCHQVLNCTNFYVMQ